jgi:hypothetical protein
VLVDFAGWWLTIEQVAQSRRSNTLHISNQ